MCVGSLYDFDKYGIPDAAVEKMQGIISDDDFQPEKLAPVSKAAAALSIWCKWRKLLALRCSESDRLLYDRVSGQAMRCVSTTRWARGLVRSGRGLRWRRAGWGRRRRRSMVRIHVDQVSASSDPQTTTVHPWLIMIM